MKWKINSKTNKIPKIGEKREITLFAWTPTKMSDDSTIWFEKYIAKQQYQEIDKSSMHDKNYDYILLKYCWVDLERVCFAKEKAEKNI